MTQQVIKGEFVRIPNTEVFQFISMAGSEVPNNYAVDSSALAPVVEVVEGAETHAPIIRGNQTSERTQALTTQIVGVGMAIAGLTQEDAEAIALIAAAVITVIVPQVTYLWGRVQVKTAKRRS